MNVPLGGMNTIEKSSVCLENTQEVVNKMLVRIYMITSIVLIFQTEIKTILLETEVNGTSSI